MNRRFIKHEGPERVAVVGGGMMGISAALEIAHNSDATVTLFEKSEDLGGLSNSYTWNGITWDRFYHVVLSTDSVMLDFIRSLDLADDLFWKTTRSGFYRDRKLVSMSSIKDFLSFPFLTLWQKFRLGLGIMLSNGMKDVEKLDRVYVREWLTRLFGRRVYERIWEPLLRSKLGASREKTSAAFIWATIKRLYGARKGSDKAERLGHVRGGYARIIEKAKRSLEISGVKVAANQEVESIAKRRTQGKSTFVLGAGGKDQEFDKVVLTVPAPDILRIVQHDENEYWEHLGKVSYLGVICVLLILKRSLSKYYVINLLDNSLPFTGIIEATNVVSPDEMKSTHLVYLPKYVGPNDELWQQEDRAIVDSFCGSLGKVFSDFSVQDVLHSVVFRERFVQPLQEVRYLERCLGFKTPEEGLYVVNTSMIYNSTINNNAVVTLAREAAREAFGESR